jgi:hypothetical protein
MCLPAGRQPNATVEIEPMLALPGLIAATRAIPRRCNLRLYFPLPGQTAPYCTKIDFRVDSGAYYSFIGIQLAKDHRLPVPESPEFPLTLRSAFGGTAVRVRAGRIRGYWPLQGDEKQGEMFDWPILFLVDFPSAPAVLGLGGVIDGCQWEFGGSHFTIRDIRPA